MPKYTMRLALKETYFCSHEVKAKDEKDAINKIDKIGREFGMSADETEIFNWEYYETEHRVVDVIPITEPLDIILPNSATEHKKDIRFELEYEENKSGVTYIGGYDVYLNGERTNIYIHKNYNQRASNTGNYEVCYQGDSDRCSQFFNKLKDAKEFVISLVIDEHYETGHAGKRYGDDPELEQWTEERNKLEFSGEDLDDDEETDWKKDWE